MIVEEGVGLFFGFFLENIYIFVVIYYVGDNIIKLVGCSYNFDWIGVDDCYLLCYEIYDFFGIFLEEISYEILFFVIISNVSGIVGIDFLFVNGCYLCDFDIDVFLIIIDGNG